MPKQIRIPTNKANWAQNPNKKLINHHVVDIINTYNKTNRSLEIKLSSRPYVDMVLRLNSDLVLSNSILSFTTDNWDVIQTIDISSRSDGYVIINNDENISDDITIYIPDGSWNPGVVNTELWVDASDEDTMLLDANKVTKLFDKSGNNRHATQTHDSLKPKTGIKTIGELNALYFDGIDDYLETDNANWINNTEFNIFAITNPDYDFVNYFCGVLGTSGAGKHMYCGWDNASKWRLANNWPNASGEADFPATYTGNDELSITSYLSTGSAAWINGTSIGTSTNPITDMDSSAPFVIGETYGPFYPFWGSIGELIVTTGTINELTRQKFEGYLAHKWGLNSELPSGHPYKSEKPSEN